MSHQQRSKKAYAAGPDAGRHRFFIIFRFARAQEEGIRSNRFGPDKRDHPNCLSPTLAYNTSPHHSSTTLPSVQHSTPTLPYNSASQQHHRHKKRTDTKANTHHQTHHQRKCHNTAEKTRPHHRMTITLPKNTTTPPQKHNHTTTKNTTTPQHTTPKRKNITQNTKLRTSSAPIFCRHSDDCATSQVRSAKPLPTAYQP